MKIKEIERKLTQLLEAPENLGGKKVVEKSGVVIRQMRNRGDLRICADRIAIKAVLDGFMRETGKREVDEITLEDFSLLSEAAKQFYDSVREAMIFSVVKREQGKELTRFLEVIEIIKKQLGGRKDEK